MKTLMIVAALGTGIVLNLFIVFVGPFAASDEGVSKSVMCMDQDLINMTGSTVSLRSDTPIVTSVSIYKQDPCEERDDYSYRLEFLKKYPRTWQFFANWAIWTAPLLGVTYLYNKKRENTRH